MTITATEIKSRRLEKNLTQEDFADKLGVSLRTVQYWEEGRKIPNSKIRNIIYIFENNKLIGSAVLLANSSVVLSEANVFLSERYPV